MDQDEDWFEVHVRVHKAKHLVDRNGIRRLPGQPFVYTDAHGVPDLKRPFTAWPVIGVSCLGESRYTEIVENKDDPTFDNQFVFRSNYDEDDEKYLSPEKLFSEELINFKYYDAGTWRSDLVLGEYGLQIHSVLTDERALPTANATRSLLQTRLTGRYGTTLTAWLCLQQPLLALNQDKIRGAGFLKVTVTVLWNNQGGLQKPLPPLVPKTEIQRFLENVHHLPPPKVVINNPKDGTTKHLEMIPSLFELVVRVYKAELPADAFNVSSGRKPYVRVLFNGHGNSHDSSIQLEDYTPGLTKGRYGSGENYRGIGKDTTVVESMGQVPVWNQEVRIPFHKYDKYTVLENVALQLRDASSEVGVDHSNYGSAAFDSVESGTGLTADHLVATSRLSLNHLMTEPKGGWMQLKDSGPLGLTKDGQATQKTGRLLPKPMWVCFYGSRFTGMQSLHEARMNEAHPGITPTDYRGRLLVQMYVEFVGPRDMDLTPEVLLGQQFMGDERVAFDPQTRIKIWVRLADDRDRRVPITCNITNTAEQVLAAFNKQHKYYIPGDFMELHDFTQKKRVASITEEMVKECIDEKKTPLEIRWHHKNLLELKVQLPWSSTKVETLYADKYEDDVGKLIERLEKKIGISGDKFDLHLNKLLSPDDKIDTFNDGFKLVLYWKKSIHPINVQEAEMNLAMHNRPRIYTLRFDLFQGMNFPEKVKGYELFVKVMIGDETFLKPQSDSKKVLRTPDGLSNYVEWGESFEHTWLKLPEQQDEIPDVMIYVCERRIRNETIDDEDTRTDDRLGFLKLKVSNNAFPFNNKDPIWMALEPDRLSPAWNNQLVMAGQPKQTGALQFRLQFGPREEGTQHRVRNSKKIGAGMGVFDQTTTKTVETLGEVARKYAGQQANVLDVIKDIVISNRRQLAPIVEEAIVEGLITANPPITVEYAETNESVKLDASRRHDVQRAFKEEFEWMCSRSGNSSGVHAEPLQLKIREVFNTNLGMRLLDDVPLMHNTVLTVPKSTLPRAVKLVMPNTHSFELRAYVYQACDLPVVNDLMPDPYIEITLGAKRIRSTSVRKSAYPVFNQVLRMEDVELHLDPTASDHEYRKAINDYSRFAEFITVKVKDDDPLVKDHDIARFEVRLAEVDIVRREDYEHWEIIQQEKEIEHLLAVKNNTEMRQSPDATPPNYTLQSLQNYLGLRKKPYSSQQQTTYTVGNETKLLEPKREYAALPTKQDWWPTVPYKDSGGRFVPIRDSDLDMLSKRELFTRSQGRLLIWIQLLHKGASRKNRQQAPQISPQQMRVAEDYGADPLRLQENFGSGVEQDTVFITEKRYSPPSSEDMSKEEKKKWFAKLQMKMKPQDINIVPNEESRDLLYYRQPLQDQSIASLVQLPNLNKITPPSVSCMVEYQIWSVAELMPVAGRQVERVYVEIDPGDQNDITKRMRTKKHLTEPGCFEGANAYIKESQRVQMKIPESLLFGPTLQIRVYDFRDGGTNKVLVGTAAVPLVRFYPDTFQSGSDRLITQERVKYLEDWRLKSPLYRRIDVLREVIRKMPGAKDAMHAETQREIGQSQFYSISVGDTIMDPSVFNNPSAGGRYQQNYRRKMRKAQIKYMANFESQEMEDNKAMMELMGAENFTEWKEKKSLKRAFGGFTALQENPNLDDLQVDKVMATTDPTSLYYRGPMEVDSSELMPQATTVGARREFPKINMAQGIQARQMHAGRNTAFIDSIEKQRLGYTSMRPQDMYGTMASFDPSTGYPINRVTGFAFDPVTNMDIDPISGNFLDSKTNLPIDPHTGFCFNRFTGKIYDPESGMAVRFNHRHCQVILDKERRALFEQDTMPEVGTTGGRVARKNHEYTENSLLGHRRIFKALELDRTYMMSIPFESTPLYRGSEGAPANMKTPVGKLKHNVKITPSSNRHEEPHRMYFPKKNNYNVRLYVLSGYAIMGNVNRGENQKQVLNDASPSEDTAEYVRQLVTEQEYVPESMPLDGDHLNLYLRVRIGKDIYYDMPNNDDQNDEGLIQVHWSTSNPDFFCCIDADVVLPGVSDMYVEVWDHPLTEVDPSKPDSPLLDQRSNKKQHSIGPGSTTGLHMRNRAKDRMVGWCKFDLQDRRSWMSQRDAPKPIEKKKLWSPTSNHNQGEIEVIVDIMPSEQAQYITCLPIERMSPRPILFEFRTIVWTIKELDFRGEFYKDMMTDRPTDLMNLPTHQMALRRNIKNFYVRATFKQHEERLAPNHLWKKCQVSDTCFNVRADSDDAFYQNQVVMAIHPLHNGTPEKCIIHKRYGTVGRNIDRYDVKFEDGYIAKYVGPNGDERSGTLMRIGQAETQKLKKAMVQINWRFCWKVNLPCSSPILNISLRDRKDKDKWCERTLDMSDLFKNARRIQKSVAIEPPMVNSSDPKKYVSGQGNVVSKKHQTSLYDSSGHCGPNAYEVDMKNANFPGTVGKMWCSFEVLPECEAHIRPAGLGRNPSNCLNVGVIATPNNRSWDCCTICCQDFWYDYRWPCLGLTCLIVAVIIMAIATSNDGKL